MNTSQSAISELLEIMTQLRDPNTGCPWDKEQTFSTISPYTIEEAYEVADAISNGDMEQLEDELGDLLFQVVFYAQISREDGGFDFDDIANRVSKKMRQRHPHVFKTQKHEKFSSWESEKSKERKARAQKLGVQPSIIDGVATALPALMRAQKLQKRVAGEGFDWPNLEPVIAKVKEELNEVHEEITSGSPEAQIREEIGDLIFACVNLARHLGIDAEVAAQEANKKFERRFRAVETNLVKDGKSLRGAKLKELENYWNAVKQSEK
ncbi:MAG: nucleoside triphosphate pyrophosphohydrolase [Pseudomonadota bacterium]|nr:nucleoside triphosphate pyrophosphohydrolase [Pseudomonadota bacterium]